MYEDVELKKVKPSVTTKRNNPNTIYVHTTILHDKSIKSLDLPSCQEILDELKSKVKLLGHSGGPRIQNMRLRP